MTDLEKVLVEEVEKPPKPPMERRHSYLANQSRSNDWNDEHVVDINVLAASLSSSITEGLSSKHAEELLHDIGYNRLTPPKELHWLLKFLLHLVGGFSILLWFGAFLCLIVYGIDDSIPKDRSNLWLGIVLMAVVIITGIFSYYQDAKASKTMDEFRKMMPQNCVIIRNGQEIPDTNVEILVPGDIVRVEKGSKVPADVRLFKSNGLKVDHSSLTGESVPLKRDTEIPALKDGKIVDYWESKNLVFFSTNVLEGEGWGIVVKTGDRTVIGAIAAATTLEKKPDTLMKAEIHRFILIISAIAVILGLTFFIIAIVDQPEEWLAAIIFCISIIVANVPEGLLATVTVALTLTAKKMEKENVLVKNLETVETLGSCTVIASDKTGTLTVNRMSVNHVFYDMKILSANPVNAGEAMFDVNNETFGRLQRCATVCNTCKLDPSDPHFAKRKIMSTNEEVVEPTLIRNWTTMGGDASEAAMIKMVYPNFAESFGPDKKVEDLSADEVEQILSTKDASTSWWQDYIEMYRVHWEKVFSVPFNSTNKYMITVVKPDEQIRASPHFNFTEDQELVLMKGASEQIAALCKYVMVEGELVEMTPEIQKQLEQANIDMARLGERVLGFAEQIIDGNHAPFEDDYKPPSLVFLGYMGLIDPARPEVPSAIAMCHQAGIRVIMVTGDHPETAKAISKTVGILKNPTIEDVAAERGCEVSQVNKWDVQGYVVHGKMLDEFDQDDWDYVLTRKDVVFARTQPKQKQDIVINLQRLNHVVGVTGDGVNDAPALKKADLGIAMHSGSPVSQEAADMVLMDDNFASIVKGIEEGRLIFDNLKKSIAYTLSSNIPEISPFLVYIVGKTPSPLTTVMILCIDLGTDLLPAISLAYEKAESDIMKRPPRNKDKDKLVTFALVAFSYLQIGMIQAVCGFTVFYTVMWDKGFPMSSMWNINAQWNDKTLEMVRGVPCTWEMRLDWLQQAQTAFLGSIVIVQWADVVICKTRKLSIFQQGMRNSVLNAGLIEETLLIVFLCYVPGIQEAFGTRSIRFWYWCVALPFCVAILIYDEIRKWFIRRNENGWVAFLTYY